MKASVCIDAGNVIAPVDDRLFSSFIEHMGRAVYTGIYEPGHPSADAEGFRQDVQELIRPLNLGCIRYPGGNFLSGYRWLDGIGPKEDRPVRPELAWFAVEPNQVGTDEFLRWCERIGVKPMLGVNLGTGTPQDAADMLEYVNGDLPTHFADMRRRNGHEEPYDVKLWCLGNEMDGPWQICGKTAEEYGRTAAETAKMMKWMDPSVELVACGSSYRDMPTFGEWERTVLRHCYEYVDYLSLHQYYQNNDGDRASFLARSLEMEDFIHTVAGICREAKTEQRSEHDVYLSFDEWNVWYHFKKEGKEPPRWTVARPIEEEDYDADDALVVGCMLNALLRNTDTVKIACLAQLVNVIAPIMTEPGGKARVQSIYWPFLYASRYGRGTALRSRAECDSYDCAIMNGVPFIDCSAVTDGTALTVFIVNRSEEETECALELTGFSDAAPLRHIFFDASVTEPMEKGSGSSRTVRLPPLSWNLVRIG